MPRIEKTQSPVSIHERAQANLAVNGSAAQTTDPINSENETQVYDVWCDETNVLIKVHATANNVTLNTGYPIKAGNVVPVEVPPGCRLGGITDGTSGTLRFHRTA